MLRLISFTSILIHYIYYIYLKVKFTTSGIFKFFSPLRSFKIDPLKNVFLSLIYLKNYNLY